MLRSKETAYFKCSIYLMEWNQDLNFWKLCVFCINPCTSLGSLEASFHNNRTLEAMFHDPCNKAEAMYVASRAWFTSLVLWPRGCPKNLGMASVCKLWSVTRPWTWRREWRHSIYVDDAEVLIDCFSFAVFSYCVTILKITFYDEKEEQNTCASADKF